MLTFDQITVTFALAGGVIGWSEARGLPKDQRVGRIFRCLFAGGAIPTGLLLLASAYDQRLLRDIKDLGLYLVASALAVLYLAYAEFEKP